MASYKGVDPQDVPVWPVVVIELRPDGRVRVDGEDVAVAPGEDARAAGVRAAASTAALIGRPVRAEARDPGGTVWPLVVEPDGNVTAAGPGRTEASGRRRGRGERRGRAPQPQPVPVPQGGPAPARILPAATPPGPEVAAAPARPALPAAPAPAAAPDAGPALDDVGPGFPERAELRRIERELQGGRMEAARSLAREHAERVVAERGLDDAWSRRAREVLAYVTFASGHAVAAAQAYVEVAWSELGLPEAPRAPSAYAAVLADNAHFCWAGAARAGEPGTDGLGAYIVALREQVDGPDSAPARAARRLVEEVLAREGGTA